MNRREAKFRNEFQERLGFGDVIAFEPDQLDVIKFEWMPGDLREGGDYCVVATVLPKSVIRDARCEILDDLVPTFIACREQFLEAEYAPEPA